MEQEAHVTFA